MGVGGWVGHKNNTTSSPLCDTRAHTLSFDTPHTHSHAGYAYCGHVMAHAYAAVAQAAPSTTRIVLLGPSHHSYTRSAHVSGASSYSTPVGDLPVDHATVEALAASGAFEPLDAATDAAEHSLELHAPWLAHAFVGRLGEGGVGLVPIMVGALDTPTEAAVAAALAPLLADPATLFVVSTDFCHWGTRFSYTHVPPGHASIADGVEVMDRDGMAAIEAGGGSDPFRRYLADTRNTICGRYPVSLLLATLEAVESGGGGGGAPQRYVTRFVAYDQSTRAAVPTDSSVSYASAVTRLVV